MSSINESVSRVRELLLSPKEQKPSVSIIFGRLLSEYQNLYNELSNTSMVWNTREAKVNLQQNKTDYLIPGNIGKILFVTLQGTDTNYPPVPVEFSDLASVSSDYYLFEPLYYEYAPYSPTGAYPGSIAFYRKDNSLYARIAPFSSGTGQLTVTYSVGNWINSVATDSSASFGEYHAMIETRAAKSLVTAAEWTSDLESDEVKRRNLRIDLSEMDARYSQNFMYAKRNLTADHTTYREECY